MHKGMCPFQRRICCRFITQFPVEIGVVGHAFMDFCTAGRTVQINNRGQLFIVNGNQLCRAHRNLRRFSNNHCDMVTYISDLIFGQYRMRRLRHRAAVTVGHCPAIDQRPHAISFNISACVNCMNTVHSNCGGDIDRFNLCMRHIRSHKKGVQLARAVNVICIAAFPGQEPLIFFPAH